MGNNMLHSYNNVKNKIVEAQPRGKKKLRGPVASQIFWPAGLTVAVPVVLLRDHQVLLVLHPGGAAGGAGGVRVVTNIHPTHPGSAGSAGRHWDQQHHEHLHHGLHVEIFNIGDNMKYLLTIIYIYTLWVRFFQWLELGKGSHQSFKKSLYFSDPFRSLDA